MVNTTHSDRDRAIVTSRDLENYSTGVSRRDFLKGIVAGATSLAVPYVLGKAGKKTYEREFENIALDDEMTIAAHYYP